MLPSPTIEEVRTGGSAWAPSASPALILLAMALLSVGLLVLPWWFGALAVFRYLFFVLVVAVGIVLYRAFPVLYVGYTWWLLFLTPLVRRIVDYQIGWQDTNLVMQALNVVMALSVFTLLRHRTRLLDKAYFPFVVALAGLAFGYATGIFQNGLLKATRGMMEWALPVLFGLHVALYWRDYPALRRRIQQTFLWGVAVMGVYGIVQFFLLPPWDIFWMNQFDTLTFWGRARPFEVRVFSTMGDYLLFGKVILAGLLVLFSLSTWKQLIAAVPGYAALLFTASRTAWGAWLVAIVLMGVWIKGRMRTRLVGVLVLGALILSPLLMVPEVATGITNRFETFQNLEDDGSFIARQRLYQENAVRALTYPLGKGFGTDYVFYDSGPLMMAYLLGWPGLLLFTTALLLLIPLLWQGRRQTDDPFGVISRAIVFAFLAMLPFATPFIGAPGAVFWCFAGLALAGYRYQHAQESEALMNETGVA